MDTNGVIPLLFVHMNYFYSKNMKITAPFHHLEKWQIEFFLM